MIGSMETRLDTNYTLMIGLLALVLLPGCASSPHHSAVGLPDAPARWRHAVASDAPAAATDWWGSFGSDELLELVRRADTQNLDLASAMARVRQAEANAVIARAGLLPGLNANAGIERRDPEDGSSSKRERSYSVALNASYEVDLWGGARAARDSARHAARASRFDRDTVRMTATADTASLWIQAVGLRERVGLSEKSAANAERVLAIVEARVAAGAATDLELSQQREFLAAQRRTTLALRQQADDALTALARLLGQPVAGLSLRTESLRPLRVPVPAPDLPSALLTRRPDIARAEAQLAAAEADLASARAAMFPRLSLTGGASADGGHLHTVLDNPVYSVAAGLAAPIFNAGRLSAGRKLAQARREELLVAYRASILSAFADVETALNAVSSLEAQADQQMVQQRHAARAVSLAEVRYRAGADTLLTLLDAQRAFYAAEDAAVQLVQDRLLASVSLYRALGGGWTASANSDGLTGSANTP